MEWPFGVALSMAFSSWSTVLTSPTIGMSTWTFLRMDVGSMSMWMTLASGQNSDTLPVTRSSNRAPIAMRSEEHTSELQSLAYLVCRLLLEKKKKNRTTFSQHTHHETHNSKKIV